jgi:hypothetical protein
MGTEGSNTGFIRSANANTLTTGRGFYLDVNGSFRFGESVSGSNNYVYWDGDDLNISGILNATEGNIGGFTIANGKFLASGSLLQIDTQIPQISFFKKGDLTSPKVTINANSELSNPSAAAIYSSGSTWTGTTSVTATSGTTIGVNTYVGVDGVGGKGITVTTSGTTITTLAAGTIDVTVPIPATTLTITAGTISTTSDYPPEAPTEITQTYSSRTAYGYYGSARWVLQLYNSTGTTLLAESEIGGASTYRGGAASNTYFIAESGGPGFLYWNGPISYTSTAYYGGNITAGNKSVTITVPSAGTYRVALALKVAAGSGHVIDSEAGTQTYYANSANASHSNTGTINYYDIIFKSNVNKAEINGGGVQIVSNETAFVKMMRIDPGSYSFGSMLMQTRDMITERQV